MSYSIQISKNYIFLISYHQLYQPTIHLATLYLATLYLATLYLATLYLATLYLATLYLATLYLATLYLATLYLATLCDQTTALHILSLDLQHVSPICDPFWKNLPIRVDNFLKFTYKSLALPLTFHMVHHLTLHSQWF